MPVAFANPNIRKFAIMQSKGMVRLHDPNTGNFLHLSGTGTTPDIGQSWMGHKHQADTLKQRAKIRGDDWPFQKVPRDDPHSYEPDVKTLVR